MGDHLVVAQPRILGHVTGDSERDGVDDDNPRLPTALVVVVLGRHLKDNLCIVEYFSHA
jgi:hypothetical protein